MSKITVFFKILSLIFFLHATFVFSQDKETSQISAQNIKVSLVRAVPKRDARGEFILLAPKDKTVKLRAKAGDDTFVELEKEDVLQSVYLTADEVKQNETVLFGYLKQLFQPNEIFYIKIENQIAENWSISVYEFGQSKGCTPLIPTKDEIKDRGSKFVRRAESFDSFLFQNEAKSENKGFAIFAAKGEVEYLQDSVFSAFGAMALERGQSTGRANADNRLMQAVGKGKVSAGDQEKGTFGITVNLGNIYNPLGNTVKPFEYYDSLLKISECSVGEESATTLELKMIWYNNRGLANYQASRLTEAQKDYIEALKILETLSAEKPRKAEEAAILSNLGQVQASLGKDVKALETYEKALVKLRETKTLERGYLSEPDESESIVLNNIAVVYEFQKNYAQAKENYEQALKIEKNPANRAVTLNNLGRVALAQNNQIEAQRFFEQALQIPTNNPNNRGSILNSIGLAYLRQKKVVEAVRYFSQASGIFQQTTNRTAQATAMSNLMFAAKELQNPRLAVLYGKQSVNLFQTIRQEISGLDKESKQGFLRNREDVYRVLADLLVEQNRIYEAQQVLAMLKEEEYAQFVLRSPEEIGDLSKKAEYNEIEQKAFAEYARLADELTAKSLKFDELQSAKNNCKPEEIECKKTNAEFQKVKLELQTANAALTKFFELKKAEFSKKVEDDAVITPQSIETLRADVRAAGKDVVLITTFLLPERYRVIITTGRTNVVRKVEYKEKNLTAEQVKRKIIEFNALLQNPALDPRPLGLELYKIFVQPIESDLKKAEAKVLLWSLDGALRYIPIHALYDGKSYLAESYQNVLVTLGRTTKIFDKADADWRVLGLGVSEKHTGFSSLPAVPRELGSIVLDEETSGDKEGVLPGRELLDAKFKLETFRSLLPQLSADGRAFNVVHLASHFKLGASNQSSALLLGDGAELSLDEILRDEELDFSRVELLTLSACDTGVPVETGDGREVESFGMTAQKKGAKAVLATLWKVADCSTGKFMSEFYDARKRNAASKSAALQTVQKAMLGGAIKETKDCEFRSGVVKLDGKQFGAPAFPVDKEKPFAHPFYWSPFILIGNWR